MALWKELEIWNLSGVGSGYKYNVMLYSTLSSVGLFICKTGITNSQKIKLDNVDSVPSA